MKLPVSAVMTPGPHTIGDTQPLSKAHEIMRAHDIRHLPVLRAGKLVGLVSLRDLHLIETLRDVDPATVEVSEAMSPSLYAVDGGAPLEGVADAMAASKYGAAVVLERGKVAGVFTTVDAMRLLGQLLRGEAPAASSPAPAAKPARAVPPARAVKPARRKRA